MDWSSGTVLPFAKLLTQPVNRCPHTKPEARNRFPALAAMVSDGLLWEGGNAFFFLQNRLSFRCVTRLGLDFALPIAHPLGSFFSPPNATGWLESTEHEKAISG